MLEMALIYEAFGRVLIGTLLSIPMSYTITENRFMAGAIKDPMRFFLTINFIITACFALALPA